MINTGMATPIPAETEMPRFTMPSQSDTGTAGDYIEEGFCEYIKSAMAVREKQGTTPKADAEKPSETANVGKPEATQIIPGFMVKSTEGSPDEHGTEQLLVAYLLSMPAPSRQAEEDAEANYLSAMEQVAAWTAQALVNPEQVETLHKTELLPEIPTTEPENPDTPQYSDSPAPEVPQLSTDGEIQANQGEAQTASPQLQSFYEALESVEVKVPQAPTPQDPAVGRDALGTPQTAIPETAGRDALGTPQAETANPVGRDALGTPLKTPDAPLTETADPAGRDSPGAPQTAKPVGRDALGTPLETLSAPLVSEEASTEKAQTQITAEQEKPLNEAELKAPLNPLNIKGKPDEMNELLERFKASEAAKEAVSAQGQVQHIDPKPVVTGKEISIFPQAETARIADEIIARIATKEGGVITFEMTLNPVELGKITIKIVMSGDSVTADITAQEENTAKLLQNATDKIQAQLDKESVKLEQFTVKHEPDYSDRQENQNGNKQQHEQKPKSEDEDIEISFAELMQSM